MTFLIFRDFKRDLLIFVEFILIKNNIKIRFLLCADWANDVACTLACHRMTVYVRATWRTVCACVRVISD